jgi:toxin ParE1/3/4
MVKIVYTDQFLINFEEICKYFDEIAPNLGPEFAQRILANIDFLKKFPKMGRIVPERNRENIREMIVGSYRLIYELKDPNIINLLILHHSARKFPSEKL